MEHLLFWSNCSFFLNIFKYKIFQRRQKLLLCSKVLSSAYSKYSKILNTLRFFFSNKIVVIRAGINKLFVRIANRECLDQTASSDLALPCLSMPFWQATTVQSNSVF